MQVAALTAARRAAPSTVGARSAIALGGAAQDVTLTPPPANGALKASLGGRKVYLVIEGLKIDALPGTHYDIYLGAPKGATGAKLRRYYVGTPSFFEAAGMPGMGSDFTFDVTDLIARPGQERRERAAGPHRAARRAEERLEPVHREDLAGCGLR